MPDLCPIITIYGCRRIKEGSQEIFSDVLDFTCALLKAVHDINDMVIA
jgi:hypothetical protein